MRKKLQLIKKNLDDKEREGKQAQAAAVVKHATELASNKPNQPLLVAELNAGSNTKVGSTANSMYLFVLYWRATPEGSGIACRNSKYQNPVGGYCFPDRECLINFSLIFKSSLLEKVITNNIPNT